MWNDKSIDWQGFQLSQDHSLDGEAKAFLELLVSSRDTLVPSPAVDSLLRHLMDTGGIAHVQRLLGVRIGRRDNIGESELQELRAQTRLRAKAKRVYFGDLQPMDPLAYILSGGLHSVIDNETS